MDALHSLLDTLRATAESAKELAPAAKGELTEAQARARMERVTSAGEFAAAKSILERNVDLFSRKLVEYLGKDTKLGKGLRANALAFVNWTAQEWADTIREWAPTHRGRNNVRCKFSYTSSLISAALLLAAYCRNDARDDALVKEAIADAQRAVDAETPVDAQVARARSVYPDMLWLYILCAHPCARALGRPPRR